MNDANHSRLWQAAVLWALSGTLGCTGQTLLCGDGTTRDGNRCLGSAPVICGPDTRLENGTCVSTPVTCAVGTHLELGQCAVDATVCAPGSTLTGGRCVTDPTTGPATRWLPNVRVCPQDTRCVDPQLATDGKGHLFVAYTIEDTQAYGVGVSASTDEGASFTQQVRFSKTTSYYLSPTIAADAEGNVFVAFYEYVPGAQGQSGTGNVFFASSSNLGATWSAMRAVTSTADTTLNYRPKLTLSGGTLWLVFQAYTAQAAPLVVMRSTDKGLTWSAEAEVPSPASAYGQLSVTHAAAALSSGELLIPYQLYDYDLTNGGYLSKAGVLTATVDAQNAVAASHVDLRTLLYSRSQTVESSVTVAANAAGQRCVALVDDPSRDYSVFAATSAQAFTAETKVTIQSDAPGAAQVGPTVAVDGSGQCHLVWFDNRTGEWQLFSEVLSPTGAVVRQERVSDHAFREDGSGKSLNTIADLLVTDVSRYAAWNDLRDGVSTAYFARGPLQPASR